MPISIPCRCGYTISAPERLAGRTLRCPKCLGEFTVPQVSAAPTPMDDLSGFPNSTLAEVPTPLVDSEPTFEADVEPAFEMTEEHGFEEVHEPPAVMEPDLADLETHPGRHQAPPEEPMFMEDEALATTHEGEVMDEEELGLFLMEDEPAPAPKKKNKKKPADDDLFG